jgi:hypothetical protein
VTRLLAQLAQMLGGGLWVTASAGLVLATVRAQDGAGPR